VPQLAEVVPLVTCTVTLWPEVRLKGPVLFGPVPQLRVWFGATPLIWQVTPAGSLCVAMDQLMLPPPGNGSVRVTPAAVPVPAALLLLKVTMKPMGLPALTDIASAVLVRVRFGHCTVTEAVELLLAELVSTVALTCAVLLIPEAQSAAVVDAVRVMVLVVPAAIVPKLQVRVVPPGTGEAGEQAAALGPPTVQLRVAGPGSTSVSVTLVELPVPPAVTTTVKLTGSPAVMGELAAVLLTDTSGQFTVTEAVELLLPKVASTFAVTCAVLVIPEAQSAAVLDAVRVMVLVVPTAIVPKLQVSVVPPATGEVGKQADAFAPPTVQLRVAGPGSTSVSVTLLELPGPLAVTTTVKLTGSPAVIGELAAVLLTDTSGSAGGVTVSGSQALVAPLLRESPLYTA